MKKKKYITISLIAIVVYFIFSFGVIELSANELKREEGLSVHLLPKRVAELDTAKRIQWGFMVSQSYELKPPLEMPVFRTPEKLIEYFKTLPQKIRENGIWMIVTHPDAYSDEEKNSVEQLKKICARDSIPLFICRGAELSDNIPKNLDECYKALEIKLTKQELEEFKATKENELTKYHFGLGRWIRNISSR